jgi:hypothetical protein
MIHIKYCRKCRKAFEGVRDTCVSCWEKDVPKRVENVEGRI